MPKNLGEVELFFLRAVFNYNDMPEEGNRRDAEKEKSTQNLISEANLSLK